MNKFLILSGGTVLLIPCLIKAQIDTAAVKVRGKMLRNKVHHVGEISLANYSVNESGDTIILNRLQPVEIITLRKYANPRDQEIYDRVVAGVRRVWLRAKEADSLWQEVRFNKDRSRESEKELRERLESNLKSMSRFEGALFLKLLSRATGLSAYDILRSVRGGLIASLYQRAARRAELDLKTRFDPQTFDEDRRLEEICLLLERGVLTPLP
jgi:hypothetical protein